MQKTIWGAWAAKVLCKLTELTDQEPWEEPQNQNQSRWSTNQLEDKVDNLSKKNKKLKEEMQQKLRSGRNEYNVLTEPKDRTRR